MRATNTLSFLVMLILLLAAPVTLAQGPGLLEGQVVNGTQGGPAIGAGVPVKLRVYDNGAEVSVQETVTAPDGVFRFEGLDTDPALEYWLEAVYQDVSYAAQEPYVFDAGDDTLKAMLNVYETTADDSAVRIGSVHIIVESFGQALRVTEVHLLSNIGDRAFVGQPGEAGAPATVFVPLPDGAVGVAFGEGMPPDRFVEVAARPDHPSGGLQDTEPVPPGGETSMVYFSYHLMIPGEGVELEREFSYPVDALNILVAQPGLELASEQLASRGPQSFQGRQYGFYTTADLPAGSPVVMSLIPVAGAETTTGSMPGAGSEASASDTPPAGSAQGTLRWIGLALSLAAVAAALVYPALARRPTRGREPAARHGSPPDLAADPRARTLLSELAALEDAYEAGTVDDDQYERQRARLYGALRS